MSDRAAFEALETARLAQREHQHLALIADLVATLLRCPLETDIDAGRRLYRSDIACPSCGFTSLLNRHYVVTTIAHWAELRCGFHGCRHRWEWDTKGGAE